MNSFDESGRLRTLPLHTDGASQKKLYATPRRELEARAEFVKRFKARPRDSGEPEMDPVLRWHLGLANEEKNRD